MIAKIPLPIVALILFLCISAGAQTTQSTDNGPPVPLAAAPSYISIGKDIAMRLQLVRENVSELKLDDAVREKANALVDGVGTEVTFLIGEMQAGRMPSATRVMGIPVKLKAARQQLMQVIGPDQAQILQDKLESIRGEARYRLGQLQNMLDDLKLDDATRGKIDPILANAHQKLNALPDAPVDSDDEPKNRDVMNRLFGVTHDEIAALLSPVQQRDLGPKFAQLAYTGATTRP